MITNPNQPIITKGWIFTTGDCKAEPRTTRAKLPTKIEPWKNWLGNWNKLPGWESSNPITSSNKEVIPPNAGPAKAISNKAFRLGTRDSNRVIVPKEPICTAGKKNGQLNWTWWRRANNQCPISWDIKITNKPKAIGKASANRSGLLNKSKFCNNPPTSKLVAIVAINKITAKAFCPNWVVRGSVRLGRIIMTGLPSVFSTKNSRYLLSNRSCKLFVSRLWTASGSPRKLPLKTTPSS